MRLLSFLSRLMLGILLSATPGCGSFIAHRIAQAPNSYPDWFAPKARVVLDYNAGFLTNFPAHYTEVGPPAARLRYRVIEPADYHVTVSMTNETEHGRQDFQFQFHADLPAHTNQWTAHPRGTVVLLHGYGLAQFAMAPWALRLGQDGWRCVLVDLRGHGRSTGKKVYYGTRETNDLSELLDHLDSTHQLAVPVAAMGESYGAALALRWQTAETRVHAAVAIAPYGNLSNAVMNIARDYIHWMPRPIIRSGIKKLPRYLGVEAGSLDTTTVLANHPVKALFIAGSEDRIMPPGMVDGLSRMAAPGSKFFLEPHATHEALAYFFQDLGPLVTDWLDGMR